MYDFVFIFSVVVVRSAHNVPFHLFTLDLLTDATDDDDGGGSCGKQQSLFVEFPLNEWLLISYANNKNATVFNNIVNGDGLHSRKCLRYIPIYCTTARHHAVMLQMIVNVSKLLKARKFHRKLLCSLAEVDILNFLFYCMNIIFVLLSSCHNLFYHQLTI